MLKKLLNELKRKDHQRYLGGLDFFKYIGPGLLVTVGFIDPGNWASNFAAGSDFGYTLLWVVTLSTVMLIVLQHNVAHLGIVTGLCLSEAAHRYAPRWIARPILGSAVLASISTSLAEILGGAIALQMLVGMPIVWGALLTTVLVVVLLFTNSYRRIERGIIGFVSVIGLSFLYELFLVSLLLIVFGHSIHLLAEKHFPLLAIFTRILLSFRLVIMLALFILFFALLYKILPNRKAGFFEQLPGAVFASIGWYLFSFGFSMYIEWRNGRFDMYGSLTTLVLFMFWLYFVMYIVLIGMEINQWLKDRYVQIDA